MSTISAHTDGDHDLALTKVSKRLSWFDSTESLDSSSFKSGSKMEMDLLAKEKEIDRQISLAEKVPKESFEVLKFFGLYTDT